MAGIGVGEIVLVLTLLAELLEIELAEVLNGLINLLVGASKTVIRDIAVLPLFVRLSGVIFLSGRQVNRNR